jgi:hypothetical protein
MAELARTPGLISSFESRANFNLPSGSVYLYGESSENRSHLPRDWVDAQTAAFVKIVEGEFEESTFEALGRRIQLRSPMELESFVSDTVRLGQSLFLDITGLTHKVWVPLVNRFITKAVAGELECDLRGVYVEPRHYTKSSVPRPGDVFALSKESHGIQALPGMATLRRRHLEGAPLVAFLGFEGWRFDAVLSALEPATGDVIPVVGIPGFRPEYPAYTFEGNAIGLERDANWLRREMATANDPFDAFHVLHKLTGSGPGLRIAMIGTKPHSLGAVLCASLLPEHAELVYDHPIRASGRTDAEKRVLVYDLKTFAVGFAEQASI